MDNVNPVFEKILLKKQILETRVKQNSRINHQACALRAVESKAVITNTCRAYSCFLANTGRLTQRGTATNSSGQRKATDGRGGAAQSSPSIPNGASLLCRNRGLGPIPTRQVLFPHKDLDGNKDICNINQRTAKTLDEKLKTEKKTWQATRAGQSQ